MHRCCLHSIIHTLSSGRRLLSELSCGTLDPFVSFLFLQVSLHIGDVLPKLPGRDAFLEHLVDLGRRTTGRLWNDEPTNGDDNSSDAAEK